MAVDDPARDESCEDCLGIPLGDAVTDLCGVCNGDNGCVDCAGLPFGSAEIDDCGACNGSVFFNGPHHSPHHQFSHERDDKNKKDERCAKCDEGTAFFRLRWSKDKSRTLVAHELGNGQTFDSFYGYGFPHPLTHNTPGGLGRDDAHVFLFARDPSDPSVSLVALLDNATSTTGGEVVLRATSERMSRKGVIVLLEDDPDDTFAWDSNSASGRFHWTWSGERKGLLKKKHGDHHSRPNDYGDGMVLGPWPKHTDSCLKLKWPEPNDFGVFPNPRGLDRVVVYTWNRARDEFVEIELSHFDFAWGLELCRVCACEGGYDACGVCEGDGRSCQDCSGTCDHVY